MLHLNFLHTSTQKDKWVYCALIHVILSSKMVLFLSLTDIPLYGCRNLQSILNDSLFHDQTTWQILFFTRLAGCNFK